MREIHLSLSAEALRYEELSAEEQRLVDVAREATLRSYAPYSHFSVGAAVLLENGETVSGTNQENAVYPSGLCAERTTLFYANSRYPTAAVVALAIAARNEAGLLSRPLPPCGACRQVMLETEQRFGRPMTLLMSGTEEIYRINGVQHLLPFAFDSEFL